MRFQIAISVCLVVAPLFGQERVDPRNMHERVWAVVPLIGSGSAQDPLRPKYAPLHPSPGTPPSTDGIIGFTMLLSDDGKHALVQFVALDRSAFKELFEDKSPEVKFFEKGKAKREDVEKEFRKYKKDFDFEQMGVTLP